MKNLPRKIYQEEFPYPFQGIKGDNIEIQFAIFNIYGYSYESLVKEFRD